MIKNILKFYLLKILKRSDKKWRSYSCSKSKFAVLNFWEKVFPVIWSLSHPKDDMFRMKKLCLLATSNFYYECSLFDCVTRILLLWTIKRHSKHHFWENPPSLRHHLFSRIIIFIFFDKFDDLRWIYTLSGNWAALSGYPFHNNF